MPIYYAAATNTAGRQRSAPSTSRGRQQCEASRRSYSVEPCDYRRAATERASACRHHGYTHGCRGIMTTVRLDQRTPACRGGNVDHRHPGRRGAGNRSKRAAISPCGPCADRCANTGCASAGCLPSIHPRLPWACPQATLPQRTLLRLRWQRLALRTSRGGQQCEASRDLPERTVRRPTCRHRVRQCRLSP